MRLSDRCAPEGLISEETSAAVIEVLVVNGRI